MHTIEVQKACGLSMDEISNMLIARGLPASAALVGRLFKRRDLARTLNNGRAVSSPNRAEKLLTEHTTGQKKITSEKKKRRQKTCEEWREKDRLNQKESSFVHKAADGRLRDFCAAPAKVGRTIKKKETGPRGQEKRRVCSQHQSGNHFTDHFTDLTQKQPWRVNHD